MRLLTAFLLTAGLGAVLLTRRAPVTAPRPPARERREDPYADAAVLDGLLAREAGALAARRATDPRVQALGELLVEDHTEATDRLILTLADRPGRWTPPALDPVRRETLDDLETAAAEDFDLLFVLRVASLLEGDLARHEAYVDAGEDEALAEHAVTAIAMLRRQLDTARRLRAELEAGGGGAAAAAPTLSQADGG